MEELGGEGREGKGKRGRGRGGAPFNVLPPGATDLVAPLKMCNGRRHVPLCPAQLVQTKNKQCKSAIILQCYHPHLSYFCSHFPTPVNSSYSTL